MVRTKGRTKWNLELFAVEDDQGAPFTPGKHRVQVRQQKMSQTAKAVP